MESLSDYRYAVRSATSWRDWYYSESNEAVRRWFMRTPELIPGDDDAQIPSDLYTQAFQHLRRKPAEFWQALDSVVLLDHPGLAKEVAIDHLMKQLDRWRPRKNPAAGFIRRRRLARAWEYPLR